MKDNYTNAIRNHLNIRGIMVAVPYMIESADEFQNPTLIDDANVIG